jgi:phosphatidylglycerophosphatase A
MRSSTGKMSLLDGVAYVLSIWFGCGLVPKAPGTAGSLGALPLYWLLCRWGPAAVAVGALVVTAVGLWSSHRTSRRLDQKDPQIICIDEVAGVFTWAAVPNGAIGRRPSALPITDQIAVVGSGRERLAGGRHHADDVCRGGRSPSCSSRDGSAF